MARRLGLAVLALVSGARGDDATCPGAVPKTNCSGPRTPAQFLSLVADPSIYDKTRRPPCGNQSHEGPTIVEVQLGLTQLNSVDPKSGTIRINGYLRNWWHDPRLEYNGSCTGAISIPGTSSGQIWEPDIYIDNLVSQTIDGMAGLTQVYPDGSVWKSTQVLLTVKASFDLAKLPYEKHTAKIVVASYSQDNTQLRVMAKGGTPGPGESGIGITAQPMTSPIWNFPEGSEEEGFQTVGSVEILYGSWDYLTMSWEYSRRPKYFVTQVIVPSVLFLLISYIQFWVSAAAVPARAALAVIPVLIMQALSNSIYSSIPQGSQFMWLDVFVQITMFLCVAAGVHFGVVQGLRLQEAKKAEKLAGLIKAKPITEKLMNLAKKEKIPLLALLRKFAPVEQTFSAEMVKHLDSEAAAEDDAMEADEAEGAGASPENPEPEQKPVVVASEQTFRVQSEEAKLSGVTEADMLFIMYARDIFNKFDKDDSNSLDPNQLRGLFTFFNIYMSISQVVKVVGMFLRDSGHPSHLDETKNCLRFSQMCSFIVQVDRYSLKLEHKSSFIGKLMGMPPSERWDWLARGIFPVLMILQLVIMYLILEAL